MSNPTFWQKYQIYLESLFVFLLAAAVRLTSLNVFLIVDEEDRWAWAVDFYRALLAGDLAGTLVGDGYPGIFPAWLETLWLFAGSLYRSLLQGGWLGDEGVYVLIHEWSRSEYLGVQRFPVVLANTLLVVIIFLYLRQLFGQKIALLAAVLISLDPFYLSDSRVNRAEALLTGLMTVSLLALILALRQQQRKHLVISAIVGGLAWLTKSQALVLLPIFGAISLVWQLRAEPDLLQALRRWLLTMLTWLGIACATFVLLWPATWTVPGPTFTRMYTYLTRKVSEESVMIFFLGRTVLDEDPGPLFYPVIFLLRATPLMLLGLLLGLWLLIRSWVQKLPISPAPPLPRSPAPLLSHWLDKTGLWVLLAYVLFYVAGMSLGSNKHDRFLMAAFPALNILAAVALFKFFQGRGWRERSLWAAGGALLVLQLVTALPYHPYYFSYFNPLAGGGPVAARLTRVGWGEGMDQVGAYLQSLEEPDSIVVATRFYRYLRGFEGKKLNLARDGEWLQADKVVFYIQQTQRGLDPTPGVIRYFQQHVPPEKTITIDGINYAWVYPNPIDYPANPLVDRLENSLSLLGYRWQTGAEGSAKVWLIWENLSHEPRPTGVRLWANGELHGSWNFCQLSPEFVAAARTPGEVVESECTLSMGALSPGLYDLQVGVQEADGAWSALDFASGWSAVELATDETLRRVSPEVAFARLAEAALPETATHLEHTYYDRVRLLAYELSPEHPQPGQTLSLTLYWQALRVLDRDAHVSIQAFMGENQQIAMVNGPPAGNERPTSSWRPGEVLMDVWHLAIPPETPAPALLRLDVGIFLPETLTPLPVRNLAGADIPAAITQIRLEPAQKLSYTGTHPLNITFGDAIRLEGYETSPASEPEGQEVVLYWRSLAPLDDSYMAFLHLIDAEGVLVAQSDTLPAQGLLSDPGLAARRYGLELAPLVSTCRPSRRGIYPPGRPLPAGGWRPLTRPQPQQRNRRRQRRVHRPDQAGVSLLETTITPPTLTELEEQSFTAPEPEPAPRLYSLSFWLWRGAIFAVIGLAFFLRLRALLSLTFHIDEFYTLAAAKYIAASGLPLYPTGLFYDPGLLFSYLAGLLFWLTGFSEASARWPAVVFGTLAVVTVYWLGARVLRSQAVGWLAALWLALSFESVDWSGKARMITLAQWLGLLTIALFWLGLTRDSTRYRLWFALSYGLTLLTHFSMVVLMPAWFVATAALAGLRVIRLHRQLWRDGLVLIGAFGLAISSGILFQPPPSPEFDIGGGNLGGKVEALGDKFLQFPPDLGHAWDAYGLYFIDRPHVLLLILSLAGLGFSLDRLRRGQRWPRDVGALFTGLIFLTAMLTLSLVISSHWQRSRYLVMQVQGLFLLLAAHGCREVILAIPWPRWRPQLWQSGAALLAAAGLTALLLPPLENLLETGQGWNRYDLAFAHVRDNMSKEDQIMTMHPPASLLYLDQSDYYLVQSSPKLIVRPDGKLGDRYSGAIWIEEAGGFSEVLATFPRVWLVTQEFWLFNSYDGYLQQQILWQMDKLWGEGGVWALASRPGAWPLAAKPDFPLNAEFEKGVRLAGYSANTLLPVPGTTLQLTLFWQGEELPLGAKVFVHLRDGDNNTLAQADHFIYDNKVPTSRWSDLKQSDTMIRDGANLTLPSTLGPGTYRILVGFYHPETFQRLGVLNDQTGESAVILREWVIQ